MVAFSSSAKKPDAILPAGKLGRMTVEQMYARFLASDASCNGRFFTGVLTTSIYCLPSCRARKPRRENVRFFPNVEAARQAGLRPCRKCHPDDFARGADPVLAQIETLAAEMRARPGDFTDVKAVVKRSGYGATRLFELFRQHYHATPADFLLHARLAAAKERLRHTDDGVADVAFAVGFDSLSAFHVNFKRLNGLTPAAYRGLGNTNSFTLKLPAGYPLPYLRRTLGRDPQSVSERLVGDTYTAGVWLDGFPAVLTLHMDATCVQAEVEPASRLPLGSNTARKVDLHEAHALVVGLLGLTQDPAPFVRQARTLGFVRLVEGRPELRISQTHSVFDGLVWSILGQQITFGFACMLKRRLTELAGVRVRSDLFAPSRPTSIAALQEGDLLRIQFSRQKADYLSNIARLITTGKLDLEALPRMSATGAERTLLAIRGLGPWSVNYILMRSLGFLDCLPLGDTGVTSGLQALYALKHRPDRAETLRLLTPFSPYRSLATAHLWQLNQPAP
ncbi:MAG: Ada metal-binding domain-containing protein [Opitutaceae bacterium]|nr:Ada metal-binding domain-containing protein [Opitutaceae bacterium]